MRVFRNIFPVEVLKSSLLLALLFQNTEETKFIYENTYHVYNLVYIIYGLYNRNRNYNREAKNHISRQILKGPFVLFFVFANQTKYMKIFYPYKVFMDYTLIISK